VVSLGAEEARAAALAAAKEEPPPQAGKVGAALGKPM